MSPTEYPWVRNWLRIENGRVILFTGKVDIGQRVSTALVRIACEELSVTPDQIVVAPVRTSDGLDEGITSGSNSIEKSGAAQRRACATAREYGLALAATLLDASPHDLTLKAGVISHRGTHRNLDIILLLEDMPIDLAVDINATFRKMPEPLADVPPRGLRDMVEGQFTFVHDLERPGMLHARLIRPPVLDARLDELDDTLVSRLLDAGLYVIRDGAFLAVAGNPEWSVVKAAQSIARACTWTCDEVLETGDVFEAMHGRTARRLAVVDGQPQKSEPVPETLDAPDFEAHYERPYTLHAALGPSAALAEFEDGKLQICTHSQGIFSLRDSIADSLGMKPVDVLLEHVPGAGCYGHNGADDVAFEAALIARAIPNTAVLLKYSREDEHAREPVGTAMAVTVQAKVDANGDLQAFWMEARGDTHRGRPRDGPNRAGPARLAANFARNTGVSRFVPEPNWNRHAGLHRNLDPIYDIPDRRMVKALVSDLPLRPSALRCLGAPANVLAIERSMDELADRAAVDPVTYRINHLSDPRSIAVLEQLRTDLRAAPYPDDGAGRGVAFAQYKNAMTRVAVSVDLTVDERGTVRLDHVRLVADAGRVVDPDGLRAQMEGGVLQGASWALYEEARWGPDGRETLDWESYPVLRFDNVPTISITVLEQDSTPSVGAGEASPAPTLAAIANGIKSATGLRLSRMPFDADAILKAALNA